jgi:glycosyltransferase involved in cell wall biosynthesis
MVRQPDKSTLLFISPIVPASSGNGLAMRAHNNLQYFAQNYNIILVVLPWYKQTEYQLEKLDDIVAPKNILTLSIWDQFKGLTAGLYSKFENMTPPPLRVLETSQNKKLKKIIETEKVDIIHIFRLYTAAKVFKVIDFSKYNIQIDLDDLDADYNLKLSHYYREKKLKRAANVTASAAEKYLLLEKMILPKCKKAFTASVPDKAILLERYSQTPIKVLPNVIDVPEKINFQGREKSSSTKLRILFLGSINYLPNFDAISFLCKNIFPLILDKIPEAELLVCGSGITPKKLKHISGKLPLNILGEVEDIDAVYEQADLMIVPLRFGSGTRIKIIESFSRNCPVVSTSVGAHGLKVTDKKHLLIAETPKEFVQACNSLYRDRGLAANLSENAYRLVKEQYNRDSMREHN